MNVGIIGLGRMGLSIAYRLVKAGHKVFGYDLKQEHMQSAADQGVQCAASITQLAQNVRIFWLMVPAGAVVDTVLNKLKNHLNAGDIVIDGGNSFFKNSVRRSKELAEIDVHFLDCGTSGGLKGKEIGFSLMIGGQDVIFNQLKPIFEAIAAPQGFACMGPAGSGHYVKMVHNGIEYSLLQAYAEGLQLLKKNDHYKDLDLATITDVWRHGSVIRSWIVDLLYTIFSHDQNLDDISGVIGENMTGRWTLEQAEEQKVAMDLLKQALQARSWSRQTGGDYSTKIVAMLRNQFGGHPLKKKNGK